MLKSPLTSVFNTYKIEISVLQQTFSGSEKVSTNLDLILGLNVPLEHASFVLAAFVSVWVTFVLQMKKI